MAKGVRMTARGRFARAIAILVGLLGVLQLWTER